MRYFHIIKYSLFDCLIEIKFHNIKILIIYICTEKYKHYTYLNYLCNQEKKKFV